MKYVTFSRGRSYGRGTWMQSEPWVAGIAAFTIVDLSLKPCEEGCKLGTIAAISTRFLRQKQW